MAEEFKHLVRIANSDLKGDKQVLYALTAVKGVGLMYANAVLKIADIAANTQVGTLPDETIKRLEEIIRNPLKFGIPSWLLDRRKDPNSGEDTHLITNDLVFTKDQDIKMMKKVKSYKGVRHMFKLPVRGQKTRSNFRRNKGKVMGVRVKSKKTGTT